MSHQKQAYFLSLYEPVHDRFEKFCRARTYGGMDPDDLISDTVLIAFQKVDELKSEASFLSFLFSIAVRLLANNNRKKKEELVLSDKILHAFPDINAQTDIDVDVAFLHQALALLPEAQREAVILFDISGFSLKEIVEIQGASLSAVKQRLKRGRQSLKNILTRIAKTKEKEVKHG